MKIVHLSLLDNPLIARLVNSQACKGHEVVYISSAQLQTKFDLAKLLRYIPFKKIRNYLLITKIRQRNQVSMSGDVIRYKLPFTNPLGYIFNASYVQKIVNKIRPDIVHVHYATGNGLLGSLTGFHPAILSVWGSDIMVVPKKSTILKIIIIRNLRYYDWICTTSKILFEKTMNFIPEQSNINQVPIGVDINHFKPDRSLKNSMYITVGTVKGLAPQYGVDILLQAFAEARQRLLSMNPRIARNLRLLILGIGQQLQELQLLASKLGIKEVVKFAGWVPNSKVPMYLNKMDIYVAMSRSESFGVAILEASACQLPVVVSNVGGLPEVVQDKVTGYIVENEDIEACTGALISLVKDRNLRKQMGEAGRDFVVKHYEWEYCYNLMIKIYQQAIK